MQPPPAGTRERPLVYLLLTRALVRAGDAATILGRALEGGVGLVQVREKGATTAELIAWTRTVVAIAAPYGVPVVVNDDPIAAERSGAAGLHLGQNDAPLAVARRALGRPMWIGISTHALAEVERARQEGADMLGFGPIFETSTKAAGRPIGTADLERARDLAAPLPVFPIGGVNVANAGLLAAEGVHQAAVSSAVLGAEDPTATVRALIAALRR